MKIHTRPIHIGDETDQSRDIAGVNKWARSSRSVGFVMFILGWFTIPIEVFLRKDFGQRWFTAVNFYAGMFLLILFATIQYIWTMLLEWLQDFIDGVASSINPFYTEEPTTLTDKVMDKSMLYVLLIYTLMGSYHLFRIRWRNRNNTALHSFDDGTSRIARIADYLIQVMNVMTAPIMWACVRLLPRKERVGIPTPRLINDNTAFTNTVAEPLLLLLLAIELHGIVSLWLFISAIALAVHANWKETAKLNKVLDFRDSVIEAKMMAQLRREAEQPIATVAPALIMQQTAAAIKDNPQVMPQMAEEYPDLMNIIEEMNRDKEHLAG